MILTSTVACGVITAFSVGVQGLQLAGAPLWLPDHFDGVALLLAVGFAQVQKASGARSAVTRRTLRLRGARQRSGTGA
jgi:ribose transport system permease protein